mgnify:CR=1 FL=1
MVTFRDRSCRSQLLLKSRAGTESTVGREPGPPTMSASTWIVSRLAGTQAALAQRAQDGGLLELAEVRRPPEVLHHHEAHRVTDGDLSGAGLLHAGRNRLRQRLELVVQQGHLGGQLIAATGDPEVHVRLTRIHHLESGRPALDHDGTGERDLGWRHCPPRLADRRDRDGLRGIKPSQRRGQRQCRLPLGGVEQRRQAGALRPLPFVIDLPAIELGRAAGALQEGERVGGIGDAAPPA